MDMQSILAKTQETRDAIIQLKEQEAEKAREEKLQRIVEAIANKAMKMAESGKITFEWMKNEASQLAEDVKTFIQEGEGQPLFDYVENGCAVFFGPTGREAIAERNFGTYKLSLEKNIEGAHFPRTLKINVRANINLARTLERRLGLKEDERVSIFSVNELMKAERDGKLPIEFVPADTISKDAEGVELAKTTTIIGSATEFPVDVWAIVDNGKVLAFRTDWYEGCGQLPKGFVFDLRYVPKPRF